MAERETINYDAKNKKKGKRKVEVELPALCTHSRQKVGNEKCNPYSQLLSSNASSFLKGNLVQKENRKLTNNKSELEMKCIKSRNSHFIAKGSNSEYFTLNNFPEQGGVQDNIKLKRHSVFNDSFYQDILLKYQVLNNKHPKKNGMHTLQQGNLRASDAVSLQEMRPRSSKNFYIQQKDEKIENQEISEKQIKRDRDGDGNAAKLQIETIDTVSPDMLASEPKMILNSNANNEMAISKKKDLCNENELQTTKKTKGKLKNYTLKLFENKILNNIARNEAPEKELSSEKKERSYPLASFERKIEIGGLSPKNFPAKSFANLLKKLKKKKETPSKELPAPSVPESSGAKNANYNILHNDNDIQNICVNRIEHSDSPIIIASSTSKSMLSKVTKPRRFKFFCCF